MIQFSDPLAGRSIKSLTVALAATLALLAGPRPVRAEIGSYIVFDVDTNEVLAAKDPFQPWYPASLSKLMTAYVVFQEIAAGHLTFTSPVKITPHAHTQPPSKMGFRIGTVLTLDAALKIILTKSANDVTAAVAQAVGGSESNFVKMMNAAAADLGMTQSSYANPHGLPNRRQITSARDMAILVDALKRKFPQNAWMFKLSGFQLGKRVYRNHNRLLTRYPGTNGMKTGFICSSGFNLAASSERNGRHLAAIVLGGYNGRERNERTAEYLEMGFRALAAREGGPSGQDLYEMVSPLPPDTPPVDLRPIVCGARKAKTAFDDGTVSEAEGLRLAAELERATRRREREVLETAIAEESIAATDPALVQSTGSGISTPDQAIASIAGVPEHKLSAVVTAYAAPAGDPAQPKLTRSMIETLSDAEIAAMAVAEAEPPALKPISYLSSNPGLDGPVTISLGGADESRPDPLSGTVIGGGPPPLPRAKPMLIAMLKTGEQIDPAAVVNLASVVRHNVQAADDSAARADTKPPAAAGADGDQRIDESGTVEEATAEGDAESVDTAALDASGAAVAAAPPAAAKPTVGADATAASDVGQGSDEAPPSFARNVNGRPLPAPRPER